MDAVLATLFTVSNDIILTIEYYRNYFIMKGWSLGFLRKDSREGHYGKEEE